MRAVGGEKVVQPVVSSTAQHNILHIKIVGLEVEFTFRNVFVCK